MDDTPDAQGFVLWGLTFGVVSHMVVAAGGPNLVYKDLPTFRLVCRRVLVAKAGGVLGMWLGLIACGRTLLFFSVQYPVALHKRLCGWGS